MASYPTETYSMDIQKTSSLKNKKDEGLREDGEKPDYLLMKMHLKDKRTELMIC